MLLLLGTFICFGRLIFIVIVFECNRVSGMIYVMIATVK